MTDIQDNCVVFCSPMRVRISKNKEFTLNLNPYRNAHYMVLNKAKKVYKEAIRAQFVGLQRFDTIKVHYRIFPKTRRKTDLGNVVSIHKKFFEDALVELGKIEDDNYKRIIFNSEDFGGIDKENPRIEISIERV